MLCQTSDMEVFAETTNNLKAFTVSALKQHLLFSQKAPLQMYDRVLNTPLDPAFFFKNEIAKIYYTDLF